MMLVSQMLWQGLPDTHSYLLGEEIPDHRAEAGQTAKDLRGWWGKNVN